MIDSALANVEAKLPPHIIRNIEVDVSGCWLWTRAKDRDGYARASLNNRGYRAHRLVYVLTKGDVPDGLVLDHLCRQRHCVNPDHLEPVSDAENLRRSPLTKAGMRTCSKGHEFAIIRGRRRCPVCTTQYELRRRAHKAQAERDRRARMRGEK